ncbi:hypothetical protein [Nocardioides astragali]|uniref:Uncharacterized protein n=1 Tax=Nocardioides astragali TaxID=1776736 RepID=A0ABW2N828_9ACTN|nr:hypothetical protein [Nocardioides astragali]
MSRTRTLLVAVACTTLLGGGLGPAGATGTAGATGPAGHGERAQRPLAWTRTSDPIVLRPNTVIREIGCSPTGSACVAVGHRHDESRAQVPAVQRWDGSAWQAEALVPAASEGLVEVDCSTPLDCVALEAPQWNGGLTRRMAVRSAPGWRWLDFQVADESMELTSVSCASPVSCVLTGPGRGVVVFDGTTVRSLPRTPVEVSTLSCPSAAYCAAVSQGAFVEWDGTTWTTSALEGTGSLTDVDCWAEQRCLAIADGDGGTSSYVRSPGSTWRQDTAPGGRSTSFDESGLGAPGLECEGTGECHLLRSFGPRRAPELRLLSWNAGLWASHTPPDPDGVVVALGCRTGECVLVDLIVTSPGQPAVLTSALHGYGTQWARHTMANPLGVPPQTYPHEAACPARDWCLVLGASGDVGQYVVRGDGAGWQEVPAALEDQRDLDCWRPDACVVVGSDGKRPRSAVLRDGRWRLLPALSPGWLVAGAITGVSCVEAHCVYSGYYRARHDVGTGIFVARRTGGAWRAQRLGPLVRDEGAFTGRPSIDCPTASRCVAVVSMRLADDRNPTSFELVLEDGRWHHAALGKGFSLFELDCADAMHCVAGGEEGRPALVMSRGADGTWRRVAVHTRNAAFYSVSCPTARECYLAGVGSRVRRLTRTQEVWRAGAAAVPRNMTDVACSGPRACLTFNAESTWIGR